MASSGKNGSYSGRPGARYVPPRRESIEEHLASARARVAMPGDGWTDKLASPRFVLDLIERKIINGPVEIDKASGPGRGRRFRPRDYHDLLELIRFKALGANRRDAWIVRLWLRGHDYPFERAKESLIREVGSALDTAQADFAPTGRWTESFSVKYDRRVRQRSEGILYPELTDTFEPIAAHMMRPDIIREIEPRTEAIASTVAEATNVDQSELQELLDTVVEAMKKNEPLDEAVQTKILGLAKSQLPPEFVDGLFKTDAEGNSEIGDLVDTLHDLYGDGHSHAKLMRMLEEATVAHFKRARKLIMAILAGDLESLINRASPDLPSGVRETLEISRADARRNRRQMRDNPWIMMLILAEYVISYMPVERGDDRRPHPDPSRVLRILKEAGPNGTFSSEG